jgi:hypothetical protein
MIPLIEGGIMRRFLRRILSWVANHSSPLLAISSLAIAVAALNLTISAQKEDRDYKELMIRPWIELEAHTTDFSVGFANNGLGPARIEDIIYHFGGECLSLLDEQGGISQVNFYKADEGTRARMLNEIFSFAGFEPHPTLIKTRQQVVLPHSIIQAGKSVTLFRVDNSSLDEFQKKLGELPLAFAQSLRNQFTARALTSPIDMKYCSMSGRYCAKAINETDEKPCALKN